MTPLWIVGFFTALITLYTSFSIPKQVEQLNAATTDVSATNLMAYRTSVVNYLIANPAATGVVADVTLSAYWLPGYIRDANWTNVITGGALYIYSTAAVKPETAYAVFKKSGKSALVGTKNAAGHLNSAIGVDTGVVLPAAIPLNAIVIFGE